MDTQIKIKNERIDPDYDKQELAQNILPMPLIEPKVELIKENHSAPTTETIKIKLEPKDYEENLNLKENPDSESILPKPILNNIKNEISTSIHDSALLDNFLDKFQLSDSIIERTGNNSNKVLEQGRADIEIAEIVENHTLLNNVKTEISTSNVDSALLDNFLDKFQLSDSIRERTVNNSNNVLEQERTDIEIGEIVEDRTKELNCNETPIDNEIRKHIENVNKYISVKKEKITSKRSHNKIDSENDSSGSNDPTRISSIKKKRKQRSESQSIADIPLVRDYNHKSISQKDDSSPNITNLITLPNPSIVKLDPSLVLPKPIPHNSNEESNTFSKKIKFEKPYQSPSPAPMQTVLKRCSKIINNLESHQKSKYSIRMLYTPINFIPPSDSSNIEYRSPLLCFKNVQYKFNSASRINFKEFGIIAPPESVAKLARIIGFETGQLIDSITSKVNSLNIKSDNDANKSFLNNLSSFSSFYTNIATQTDQLPCDQCVKRKLSKRHDISVQAVAGMNEIAVQTEQEDELPMIKEFHTLNMNQQLALNDFYSIIISGQPANANDKHKIRDRLLQIFDMAVTSSVPLIAPPAPVLPPNFTNTGLNHPLLGYPSPMLATSHQQMYEQYYQPMILDSYLQPQPTMHHLPQIPISRNNNPRANTSRHTYDKYSRENNSKRY